MKPKESAETTILDGTLHQADLKDGTSTEVKVRKFAALKMSQLQRAMISEEAELACYLAWPVQQIEQLTDESAISLLEEGRRLNFSNLAAFLKRQDQLAGVFAKGGSEETQGLVKVAVQEILKSQG